jgi:hypothetical protein
MAEVLLDVGALHRKGATQRRDQHASSIDS